MRARHPVERQPDRHLRSRRPEEQQAGLLRVGQEQLRAARRGGVDADGERAWCVRGGYTKVFDRVGVGLATNFDEGFAFGMSTTDQQPVRRRLRNQSRPRAS